MPNLNFAELMPAVK